MSATLGDRIRMARVAHNMTQEELANTVGTTKQNIYKYETGIITNIPLERVEKIANALFVAPGWLMGWSNMEPGASHPYTDLVREKVSSELASFDPADVEAASETMDVAFLHRLVDGNDPVTIDDVFKACDMLGITIQEMLNIEEPADESELADNDFIRQFQLLDKENQERIVGLMRALLESRK